MRINIWVLYQLQHSYLLNNRRLWVIRTFEIWDLSSYKTYGLWSIPIPIWKRNYLRFRVQGIHIITSYLRIEIWVLSWWYLSAKSFPYVMINWRLWVIWRFEIWDLSLNSMAWSQLLILHKKRKFLRFKVQWNIRYP